ncbi:MAG: RDD family protein [Hymenobacteraceae bacterium]|nr:RDD family protein [Hymenobacteraceae bacterium]
MAGQCKSRKRSFELHPPVFDEPVYQEPVITGSPFPSLLKRVQAAFVDMLLPLVSMFFLAAVLPGAAEWPTAGKVALGFICLLYEPILTSRSLAVGQRLTGIRVRQHRASDQPISFLMAYCRFIIKMLFGWASYLFIHANSPRRALHDLVAGSVVVKNS